MRDDKVYCDTCDLAYNMYMYSHNPDGNHTILIAGYEIVSEMLKDLMQFEDTTAFSIHLDDSEADGYEDEYILTLDDEQNVWIEPFKNKKGNYLIFDDEHVTLVFVHNDVNSKAILGINKKVIQPFEFKWEQ